VTGDSVFNKAVEQTDGGIENQFRAPVCTCD